MRNEFNLIDKAFSHDTSSVAGREAKFISWRRDDLDSKLPIFVSDSSLLQVTPGLQSFESRYAWTIESRSVRANPFSWLEGHFQEFDSVFTHDEKLLNELPNAKFSPGGGVWIGGVHAGGNLGLHEKSKLISMVTSRKIRTPLHRRRLAIAHYLRLDPGKKVDTWINAPYAASWAALESYMFNVAVENHQSETYFTEKLLNCFATGTVPIYFGATNISPWFDMRGVIPFRSLGDLRNIVNSANEETYSNLLPYVAENFKRVQDFLTIEDYLATNYFEDMVAS
jgi:hypothetical protein